MSIATFLARRCLAVSTTLAAGRPFRTRQTLVQAQRSLFNKNEFKKVPSVCQQQQRSFRTSQPRQVNPILIALVKPLSRLFAALAGRRFRVWWKNLPEDKRLKLRLAVKQRKGALVGLGVAAFAGIVYAYESHIQECPITKRRRFVALTRDQVNKIAVHEFQELNEEFAPLMVPERSPYYSRMTRVASRILKSNSDLKEIGGREWTVTVIERDDKNAFVLPTGNIFVFTGLLDFCKNDDQLGVIISHEIAHTVLNHAGELLGYVNFLNALLMIPLAVLWAFVPSDGIAVVADWFFHRASSMIFELPFNRVMETEADEVGLLLAAKACFDIREAPAFWAMMELHENEDEKAPIEFLSTHPAHKNRESNMAAMVPEAINMRTSCGCPKLSPTDPYEEFKKFAQIMKKNREVFRNSPAVFVTLK